MQSTQCHSNFYIILSRKKVNLFYQWVLFIALHLLLHKRNSVKILSCNGLNKFLYSKPKTIHFWLKEVGKVKHIIIEYWFVKICHGPIQSIFPPLHFGDRENIHLQKPSSLQLMTILTWHVEGVQTNPHLFARVGNIMRTLK